jgi:hypothetical protein
LAVRLLAALFGARLPLFAEDFFGEPLDVFSSIICGFLSCKETLYRDAPTEAPSSQIVSRTSNGKIETRNIVFSGFDCGLWHDAIILTLRSDVLLLESRGCALDARGLTAKSNPF